MPDENPNISKDQNTKGDRKRVLIVDDSPVMRKIMEKILTAQNFEICGLADDGDKVLDLYKELRPDVVTLDLNMPITDGMTALRQVMEFDPDARVIMLTGAEDKQDIIKAISLGARGYILKPPTIEGVLDKIKAALE